MHDIVQVFLKFSDGAVSKGQQSAVTEAHRQGLFGMMAGSAF